MTTLAGHSNLLMVVCGCSQQINLEGSAILDIADKEFLNSKTYSAEER